MTDEAKLAIKVADTPLYNCLNIENVLYYLKEFLNNWFWWMLALNLTLSVSNGYTNKSPIQ